MVTSQRLDVHTTICLERTDIYVLDVMLWNYKK